jgi:dTDP-4-dehydrorhamnose 3,5-epimerase
VKFVPLALAGAFSIEVERHKDERGFFARTWDRDEFAQHGLDPELAQCSISRNIRVGTLRGMHFQTAPHQETKIVRCTRGTIFDVIVDLRPGSPTQTQWVGVELDADLGNALYIPKGFAHGFQTLTDDSEVLYMISERYAPEAAGGVRWDDPAFGIEWPYAEVRTMNERDRAWPDYEVGSRRTRGA